MRMKRLFCLIIACTVALSLAACGGGSTSSAAGESTASVDSTPAAADEPASSDAAEPAAQSDRTKATVMLRSSESDNAYQIWSHLLNNFFAEKGYTIDVEYELLPNDGDYANKLQLYVSSNQLPDIFGCANGTFSSAAKSIDSLLCVEDEMKKLGNFETINAAVADFFGDAEDGKVWLFPESFNSEFFFYRTDKFEQYGLSAPATWDDFLQVCDTLKQNGEIPVLIAGAEQWQIMRYLSFMPWRVTHDEFIMSYINQTDTFAANEAAQKGINLVKTMGELGYWQPSFTSTNYTDATNLFFGGEGCILYAGSWLVGDGEALYDEGKLGLFPVPDVVGMDNMSTNTPVHGGFATAFNASTYDTVMEEFFAYACDNYGARAYEVGTLSPFNEPIPDTMHPLYKEVRALGDKSTAGWVSWDDKLDAATLVDMADAQEELALGMITEEEFITRMDEVIITNSKS